MKKHLLIRPSEADALIKIWEESYGWFMVQASAKHEQKELVSEIAERTRASHEWQTLFIIASFMPSDDECDALQIYQGLCEMSDNQAEDQLLAVSALQSLVSECRELQRQTLLGNDLSFLDEEA